MNDLLETIKYKGVDIQVFYDTDCGTPNENGNTDCFLVYDHRQFSTQVEGFEPSDINEEITRTKKLFYKGCWVFPTFAYIHSGVSLSLGSSEYPFSDRWDVSMKGFVLVNRTKVWSYTKKKAEVIAESVIKEWNSFLSGEVYGYIHEFGSCWGFCGDEGKKDMIDEAKAEIDYEIEKRNKKILAQHLYLLKNWMKHHVPIYIRDPLKLIHAIED
jgi:hypothetical protein